MNNLERIVGVVARWLRRASMLCLALMMLIMVLEVVIRLTFGFLILGKVEVVQAALLALMFFALPEVCLRREHVVVEAIDRLVSRRAVRRLRISSAIIVTVFILLMSWRVVLPALDSVHFGDTTTDLHVPLWAYWLIIVIGTSAAALACFVALVREVNETEAEAG